jgi:hypothetical protein
MSQSTNLAKWTTEHEVTFYPNTHFGFAETLLKDIEGLLQEVQLDLKRSKKQHVRDGMLTYLGHSEHIPDDGDCTDPNADPDCVYRQDEAAYHKQHAKYTLYNLVFRRITVYIRSSYMAPEGFFERHLYLIRPDLAPVFKGDAEFEDVFEQIYDEKIKDEEDVNAADLRREIQTLNKKRARGGYDVIDLSDDTDDEDDVRTPPQIRRLMETVVAESSNSSSSSS